MIAGRLSSPLLILGLAGIYFLAGKAGADAASYNPGLGLGSTSAATSSSSTVES